MGKTGVTVTEIIDVTKRRAYAQPVVLRGPKLGEITSLLPPSVLPV